MTDQEIEFLRKIFDGFLPEEAYRQMPTGMWPAVLVQKSWSSSEKAWERAKENWPGSDGDGCFPDGDRFVMFVFYAGGQRRHVVFRRSDIVKNLYYMDAGRILYGPKPN